MLLPYQPMNIDPKMNKMVCECHPLQILQDSVCHSVSTVITLWFANFNKSYFEIYSHTRMCYMVIYISHSVMCWVITLLLFLLWTQKCIHSLSLVGIEEINCQQTDHDHVTDGLTMSTSHFRQCFCVWKW